MSVSVSDKSHTLINMNVMFMLQVRSRSSVSFANDALRTAVTVRNTHRSIRPPSPMTARPWAVQSHTPTPAPCANTWRSMSSHHLPPNPRTHTTPSCTNNTNNLIRLFSSHSTSKWTASLHRSLIETLISLPCPITTWIAAQWERWTISSLCGVHPPWPCLLTFRCPAWRAG